MRRPDEEYYLYAIVVENLVRYIGISYDPGRRFKEHKRECLRYTSLMSNKFADAIKKGSEMFQIILAGPLSRKDAEAREVAEIRCRGGCTSRDRQLWNSHKGGYGGSSESSSAVLKNRWATDAEFRERMSLAAKRQIKNQREMDPSFEAKRLIAIKAISKSKQAAENLARARKSINRDKQREAVSKVSKLRWQDPEYRIRQLAALHAGRIRAIDIRKSQAGA